MTESPCPGCGAVLPDEEGPTHAYIGASPACWRRYGELLARDYGDWRPGLHRLSVDTYAAQHPGRPERRSIQSVGAHLMALCLVLDRDWPPDRVTRTMAHLLRGADRWEWLEPPADRGSITVVDVAATTAAADYERAVREWAEAVWRAWAPHHDAVRARLDRALSSSAGP